MAGGIQGRARGRERFGSAMSTASKADLRRAQRALLRQVPAEVRQTASAAVAERLLQQPFWASARAVMLYMPLPDELDVRTCLAEALRSGKVVALPRFRAESGTYGAAVVTDPEGLRAGPYGIPEPPADAPWHPLNQLDLVLVPGLAFDASGTRLGRGKGFYDRLLAETHGAKCGVALEAQLLPVLPRDENDIAMDYLITPFRCLQLSSLPPERWTS